MTLKAGLPTSAVARWERTPRRDRQAYHRLAPLGVGLGRQGLGAQAVSVALSPPVTHPGPDSPCPGAANGRNANRIQDIGQV